MKVTLKQIKDRMKAGKRPTKIQSKYIDQKGIVSKF